MLVKISSLSECKEKGFTLNKQIETEAKELAEEYVWSARIELDVAIEQAKTIELKKALQNPRVLGQTCALARTRAFEETAEKYRVKEES